VRDAHAADDDMIAGPEGVHVDALADACRHPFTRIL
jgi:hypothetical protein